jgi:hypothetical protein
MERHVHIDRSEEITHKTKENSMSTATAAPSAKSQSQTARALCESIVAVYKSHREAEEAVRKLERGGIPIQKISIIGRDFQLREDVQGYYRPSDAAKEGAGFGAWFGGLFGLLMGFGFFVLPVAGPIVALGPIAGMIAGAIGGAGIGALVNTLVSMGMSRDQALKYEARLQAGEFLLTVVGTPEEIESARNLLQGTGEVDLQTFENSQTAA